MVPKAFLFDPQPFDIIWMILSRVLFGKSKKASIGRVGEEWVGGGEVVWRSAFFFFFLSSFFNGCFSCFCWFCFFVCVDVFICFLDNQMCLVCAG